jgi:hypothetical protein
MGLAESGNILICKCGNEIFTTMGDQFGFTVVECNECESRISIIESTLIAEKLLSPYGEDYCIVYGRIDDAIAGGIAVVDYLLFIEFETAVLVSAKDRIEKVRLAKQDAVEKQWFERAARLRQEEKIIERILQQENKFLGR